MDRDDKDPATGTYFHLFYNVRKGLYEGNSYKIERGPIAILSQNLDP